MMKLVKQEQLVVGQELKLPGRSTGEINFDNAATTPPFVSVLNALMEFAPYYSSVHRGKGVKSQISSDVFDRARLDVLNFVKGSPDHDTVIFVKNTTEAINKLANRLTDPENTMGKNIVLSTAMEHHSNDLPWRKHFQVNYINIDHSGRLLLDEMEEKLRKHQGKVRLVAVTGASNVTGYVNPIHDMAETAHRYGAEILVDAAQLAPHCPINMGEPGSLRHIDYLAFSAHKMYAPFGSGVLIGPKTCFEKGNPDYSGGGTVKIVTDDYILWDNPPQKEEAGTPNLMGVVALTSALKTLNEIGMVNIERHEAVLTQYALAKLKKIPGITLYTDLQNGAGRIGVIPFNMQGFSHEQLAECLSKEAGIAVRNGCFCAHPYVQRLLKIPPAEMQRYKENPNLPKPGMVRISFGIYNTLQEIDILTECLENLSGNKSLISKEDRDGYSRNL